MSGKSSSGASKGARPSAIPAQNARSDSLSLFLFLFFYPAQAIARGASYNNKRKHSSAVLLVLLLLLYITFTLRRGRRSACLHKRCWIQAIDINK